MRSIIFKSIVIGFTLSLWLLYAGSAAGQDQKNNSATLSGPEQLALELLNRARANPEKEAERFGIKLNEGLDENKINAEPKQPLAPQPNLIQAARAHSQWMFEQRQLSHYGKDKSMPYGRMQEAGYPFGGRRWSSAENVAMEMKTAGIDPAEAVRRMHRRMFVDEGNPERGHRVNMLKAKLSEVGIGNASGTFKAKGREWEAIYETQNFANAGNRGPFLTGVAYRDKDGNGFYGVGEGLENVLVRAEPKDGGSAKTTKTRRAGGYVLEVSPGEYKVSFEYGPEDAETKEWSPGDAVVAETENVKVDWVMAQ